MDVTLAQTILWLVKLSVLSTVFALGLNATLKDITYLVHNPGLFARSLLAMYVLTPLVTVLLVLVVAAPLRVEVAVLLMAISAKASNSLMTGDCPATRALWLDSSSTSAPGICSLPRANAASFSMAPVATANSNAVRP
jgi:hypothetical protein